MEWVEAEGKTRNEAEEKLKEALGVSDLNSVEVENVKVVRKFMGMGGRTVKLRGRVKEGAAAKPAKEEPVAVISDLAETEPVGEDETPMDDTEVIPEEEPEEIEEPVVEEKVEEKKPTNGVVTGASLYRPWASEGPAAIVIPPEGRGFGARLYKINPSEEDEPENEDLEDTDSLREEEEFIEPNYEDAPGSPVTEEERDEAVKFVQGLIDKMDLEGKATGYRLADRLLITMDTDNGGLLIGRKGETLDSFQYLVDIIINRKRESRVRIILDTELYRERRRFKIYKIAKSAGERAAENSRPVRLSPMTPTERQIVHSTLAENSEVETISEGQGARRRVVIYPQRKKKNFNKGPRRDGHGGGRGGGGRGRDDRGGRGGRDSRDDDRYNR